MKTIQDLIAGITEKNFVQATFSKPRPFSPYTNIAIRPVKIQDEIKYQATYKTNLHDQVENFDLDRLKVQLHLWAVQNFFFLDVKTRKEDIRLMQSKKGKVTITRKSSYNKEKDHAHDKKKSRRIPEDAPFLKALDLSSSNGKVYSHGQKKYKQLNHYVELINGLLGGEPVHKALDMGSGKGYLTFALYEYLLQLEPKVKLEGIELREDLVAKCNALVKESGYKGLTFRQGSIDTVKKADVDLVIALHACDTATDMAIAKGIEAGAKYIAVAPCCHKQIRKEMQTTKSVLNPLLSYGIFKERQAEMITDTIRALLLESKGYSTKVFEFISTEHTAKNIMITARNTGHINKSALQEINQLKAEFGIKEHYLETLL